MSRILRVRLYRFDELSDKAKEKARRWYRADDDGLDYDWWQETYIDFQHICELLGIELKTRSVPLMDGTLQARPCIFFRGFSCQGDGASFEGTYRGAADAVAAVRDYAPEDVTLHTIADVLNIDFVQPYAGTGAWLEFSLSSGHYVHSNMMQVDKSSFMNPEQSCEDALPSHTDKYVLAQLRRLADWLYTQLSETHEYLTSDEAVDETIMANDYSFRGDGSYFSTVGESLPEGQEDT